MIADILNGLVDVISAGFHSVSAVLNTLLDTFLDLDPKARAFWGPIGLAILVIALYALNKKMNRWWSNLPNE
jgi:hypothetical protein